MSLGRDKEVATDLVNLCMGTPDVIGGKCSELSLLLGYLFLRFGNM